ncbi:MAG TPA: glycosyltransferase family 4 protein, partial [Chloroflexota bacterium]
LGLAYKLLVHRPFVYTVPALFEQMREAGLGWAPGLYRRFHGWVDRFYTAYPSELQNLGVPDGKIEVLEGVLDLDEVETLRGKKERFRREVRDRLGVGDEAPLLLSVGRLHPSKGHEYGAAALPHVLAKFPEAHWIVLGQGPGRPELEAQIRRLGCAEHVHLEGFVQEPLPYYAAADVFLRTYVTEAENLSSYQAMGMGLPVVGFDTGAETELLRVARHGTLVPNRDATALARGVIDLLSAPDHRRIAGERGLAYARNRLDVRSSLEAFRRDYRRLAQAV